MLHVHPFLLIFPFWISVILFIPVWISPSVIIISLRLLFTAFLPQFVDVGSSTPVGEQFVYLGVLFLLLEWVAIALYGWLGAYMQRWFSQPGPRRMFNRVSASLLGCAGLGLLAARR